MCKAKIYSIRYFRDGILVGSDTVACVGVAQDLKADWERNPNQVARIYDELELRHLLAPNLKDN